MPVQVLRQLPLDRKQDNRPRMVQGAVFTRVPLQPLTNPQLVAYSADALRLLDLTPEEASSLPVQLLNRLPVHMSRVSQMAACLMQLSIHSAPCYRQRNRILPSSLQATSCSMGQSLLHSATVASSLVCSPASWAMGLRCTWERSAALSLFVHGQPAQRSCECMQFHSRCSALALQAQVDA